VKIAIFFPPGGSGKLIHSIVEILLGNELIQGPTSFGAMHHSGRWKYKIVKKTKGPYVSCNGPIVNADLPDNIAQPIVTIGHLSATEVINIIPSIVGFKILYIYTTSIADCITMSNRNMYKHIEAEFDELYTTKGEEMAEMYNIHNPKHFKDIPDSVVEQSVVDTAMDNLRYRPLKTDLEDILQLDYATMFENTDTVDKICKFLNLYANTEQAKKVYSEYITIQDDCPEYATIKSIKKCWNKRR